MGAFELLDRAATVIAKGIGDTVDAVERLGKGAEERVKEEFRPLPPASPEDLGKGYWSPSEEAAKTGFRGQLARSLTPVEITSKEKYQLALSKRFQNFPAFGSTEFFNIGEREWVTGRVGFNSASQIPLCAFTVEIPTEINLGFGTTYPVFGMNFSVPANMDRIFTFSFGSIAPIGRHTFPGQRNSTYLGAIPFVPSRFRLVIIGSVPIDRVDLTFHGNVLP